MPEPEVASTEGKRKGPRDFWGLLVARSPTACYETACWREQERGGACSPPATTRLHTRALCNSLFPFRFPEVM